MILTHLTLRNFCLYGGEQTFDLAPARRRGKTAPIVLFGGINGGGKTTLLDAVQLVLYGKRAVCSKRNDKSYEEFLRESIHHGADPGEGAAIELGFRYASGGHEQLYHVCRSWSVARGRVREKVQVHKDGQPDNWTADNWHQLVEELIPLGIAQLCFFDAEKIRFLAEDETSTQALGGAIKSLLGLDLAERLVADAAALEAKIARRAPKSPELEEVGRLESELTARQEQVEQLTQELGSLENHRLVAKNRAQKAGELFAQIGGQHWQDREARQRQLGELEHALTETQQRMVALAATELPLTLVPELVQAALRQADRERQAAEAEIVAKMLTERDDLLLRRLQGERIDPQTVEVIRELLESDRAERTASEPVEPRLQLSEPGRRLLEYLLERGFDERRQLARQLLEQWDAARRTEEDVRRTIAATPDEDAVREVAEELKAASAELADWQQQVNRLEKQRATARGERDEMEKQLTRLRRKVVDAELRSAEDSRMAALLVRTQGTMREFLRRATTSKIDRLSQQVTESFRFLLRKQSLVERVLIDPETFAITLYDDTGRAIPKQRLSEGEKQIFAISVLWGLSRCSARPLPAIIDTPMARLDATHRNKLVERYFPHASHQVIVLSTDTEIECDYFHQLQPSIARAYHLNYDELNKVTIAEEGYFWEPVGR